MRAADGAMLIVALAVAWSLYRANRDIESFNLLDLVIENGRVGRMACIAVGAFAVLSWIMIRLTLDGKMSEGYMGLYGALCFTPIVAKLFSQQPAVTSTSTTSTSTTVVPAVIPTSQQKGNS